MNSTERKLLEAFLDKQNPLHSRATTILFYGTQKNGLTCDNSVSRSCKKAVRMCFQGKNYMGDEIKKQLYDTFVSLFWQHLYNQSEKLLKAENLGAWIFVVASRFCNSNREKINYILGITSPVTIVPLDVKYDKNEDMENDVEPLTPEISDNDDDDGEQASDYSLDVPDESDDDSEFSYQETARLRLESYFKLILSSGKLLDGEYYVSLLKDAHINMLSKKDLAAKYSRTTTRIDKDLQNARSQLVRVALMDIRKSCMADFKIYGNLLTPVYQKALSDFFADKPFNSTTVVAAYRALRHFINNDYDERIHEQMKDESEREKVDEKFKKFEK